MSIKNHKTVVCLLLCLVLFGYIWHKLVEMRQDFNDLNYIPYTAPSIISGPVSLEFKGIVSDFFFLELLTAIGEKIGKKELLDKRHADYIYQTCDIITDLDPFFWDPYLFGTMSLSWGFSDIQRTNELLFKAKNKKPNDFRPPYYIGFNYFYFMKDNLNGSKYLMQASLLPGCPSYIPALAARLSVKAQQYKVAIVFLEDMIAKTHNKKVTNQLRIRLKTLVMMDTLEIKITEFKARFGHYPATLTELVDKKLISRIPEDPYGGRFYITEGNKVFTTSELRKKTDIKRP